MRKLTTEEFIAKARLVHGDKYDYSKAEYTLSNKPVTIICTTHGEFSQIANDHLQGAGCRKCASLLISKKTNKGLSKFIEDSVKVHNGLYSYEDSIYINSKTPIIITCRIHGNFEQTPNDHLNGAGCPHCARESQKCMVYGVGYNDLLYTRATPSYLAWTSMLERCYSPKYQHKKSTYQGCYVCKEWHTFSNFKSWFDSPDNGYHKSYQLDKDILVKGNKVYSPNTCCLVPSSINSIITNRRNHRGKYPIGVTIQPNGKFLARVGETRQRIGIYDSPIEAFNAYKNAKERLIRNVAEKYFQEGKITEKVYNALMKYEVEITD